MTSHRTITPLVAVLGMACGSRPPLERLAPSDSPALVSLLTPVGSHGFSVVIRDDEGKPVPDAVVDAVSPDQKPLPLLVTDRLGTIVLDGGTGTYELTVTSPVGFARTKLSVSANGHVVVVDSNCHVLAGEITGRWKEGLVVWFFAMDAPQSFFGARIGAGGHYQVCLPAGGYMTEADEGYVMERGVVVLPRDQKRDLIVVDEASIDSAPPSVPLQNGSLEEFVSSLSPEVRLLGMGESNHGTSEYLKLRVDLFLRLAETRNFKYIMLEAGAAETDFLDDYVQGGAVDIRSAVARLGYWIWDTEEFLSSLARLRKFNQSTKKSRRIHLLGFDVQHSAASATLLLKDNSFDGSPSSRALLTTLQADGPRMDSKLTVDQRKELRVLVTRVEARLIKAGGNRTLRRRLAARQILHRMDMLDAVGPYGDRSARDLAMADMVQLVRKEDPDAGIALWGHSAHFAARSEGLTPMGQYLRASLGDSYYSLTYLSQSGAARAWDANGEIGVIVHDLAPAPLSTVEGAFGPSDSSVDVNYVSFAGLPKEFSAWLSPLRRMREFGSNYTGAKNEWEVRPIADAFDGVVVLRKTSPTTPTPTGVRVKK